MAKVWRLRPVGSVLFLSNSASCAALRSLAVAWYLASTSNSAARLPAGGRLSGRITRSFILYWGLSRAIGGKGLSSWGEILVLVSGRNKGLVFWRAGHGGMGRRGETNHGNAANNRFIPVNVLHEECELSCVECGVVGRLRRIRVSSPVQIRRLPATRK